MAAGHFESLENRKLLSASLTTGILTVGGTAGGDTISVTKSGTSVVTKVGAEVRTFALAGVAKIVVNAGAGNDTVSIGADLYKPTTLNGGDGNDDLKGGGGNDSLNGGGNDDRLRGGSGRDTYAGGAGRDVADYSGYTGGVKADLDGVADDGATGEGDNVLADVEDLKGGSADDTLIGDGDANDIDGNGGNDTIRGEAGNDDLSGDAGNDKVVGGLGNDILRGGTGNDDLDGEGGDDNLGGDGGTDTLNGGEGKDTFNQDGGRDNVEDPQSVDTQKVIGTLISVNTTTRTITISIARDNLPPEQATYTVGAEARIYLNDAIVPLGNLPTGLKVTLSILKNGTAAPIVTSISGSIPTTTSFVNGSVVSVDTSARTITVSIPRDLLPPEVVTYPVGPEAKVRIGDAVVTLGSLTSGLKVKVTLTKVGTNPAVATAIDGTIATVVSTVNGSVVSVDSAARTITVSVPRDLLPPDVVTYAVGPEAKIRIGDTVVTLASLTSGLKVKVTLSKVGTNPPVATAIDGTVTTVTSTVNGAIVSTNTTTPRTITVSVPRDVGEPIQQTYTLGGEASIKVDGIVTPLASLPVGLNVKLTVVTVGTNAPVVSAISATGRWIERTVVSITLDPRTISTRVEPTSPIVVFNVSPTAQIKVNNVEKPLSSVPIGVRMALQLSALDESKVIAITATAVV